MTQAIILAGGKGTRLASLLNGKPKCLIDVGGVPLLERQIQLLKSAGVSNVLLLVNHAADQVADYLAEKNNFGIQIRLIDDGDPRGTSGAVLSAFNYLEDIFFVLYGDTLLNVDLERMLNFHEAASADVTLFLHPNDHPADSDLVEIDSVKRVKAFHPYPHPSDRAFSNLVNAALYIINKSALEGWDNFKTSSDFGKDLFPAMLTAGKKLKGYVSFEYIKDVGTPLRLTKAIADISSGMMDRACLRHKQRAIFLDRDGTINVYKGLITSANDIELYPNVPAAIKKINESEFRAVLITNQPVIARGDISHDDLRNIHAKLETLLGNEGAYLDAIYFCPHHPDSGYPGEITELKIECDCRKPKTGLIEQAVHDLNIDLSRSWFVGDTTRDIETARRAGIKSVLVETGEGGRDERYSASANYQAAGLSDAVIYILSNTEASE